MSSYSVIIPTRNNPAVLERCLTHLNEVVSPMRDWESLVIDNSDDPFLSANKAIVHSHANERFKYHAMPPQGLMAARHLGADLAKGDVICFIDDDSFVDSSWLQGIDEAFEDQQVVLVTGPIRGEFEAPPPKWLGSLYGRNAQGSYCTYLSLLDLGDADLDIDPLFVWGCNYSIRKDLFYAVRGSHPDYLPPRWWQFQGDGECGLSVKVRAFGYNARYSPKCSIRHFVPERRVTFEYLGNRAFFVGVHSSFTDIRRRHGLDAFGGVPDSTGPSIMDRIIAKVRQLGNDIKQIPEYKEQIITVWKLRNHLKKCYEAGYRSHKSQVKRCPQLLQYVTRRDYLGKNGTIPDEPCIPQQGALHP